MTVRAHSIYFDHNATTALADECLAAMDECLLLGPLNTSSKHCLGDRAKGLMAAARSSVAAALSATAAEIVFTSSGTESNHLAILGSLALLPQRRHIISSEVEHPATLMLLRALETQGVRVSYLPVDGNGELILDALADTLAADTALVSLMWANNETGVLFPIERAAELSHARGVLFHTDAVQAVGKLPIDLRHVPVDLLSVSGHKLYAPTGTGALYVRKGIKLPPQLWGHQERGRRGGTENVAGIVALGVACAALADHLPTEVPRLQALRRRLEEGVLAQVRDARVNGAGAVRVANTSNIRLGGLNAEIVLGRLDRLGICASAGAACAANGTKPSHVLRAMGLSPAAALACVRFSLGRHNTEQEVDELLRVLPEVLNDLAVETA